MERIFEHTWIYIGHDSQVPNPGDYITTTLCRKPVIMSRHADGKVGAAELGDTARLRQRFELRIFVNDLMDRLYASDEINRRLGTTFPLEDEQTRESYLECIRAGGLESRTTHLCSLFDGAIRSGETGIEIDGDSGLL